MSHPVSATEDNKRTTMEKKTNQQPLPSTSKESNKDATRVKTLTPSNMPHIIPIPSNGKAGAVKYIQVSPIKCLPKGEIPNLIKLPAGPIFEVYNIKPSDFQKTYQASGVSKVKVLKPIKDIEIAPKTSAGNQEIIRKSPQKDSTVNTAGSSLNSNRGAINIISNLNSIPMILQKKALLKLGMSSGISHKITISSPPISNKEQVSNVKIISHPKLPTSQETKSCKEEETNKTKPISSPTKQKVNKEKQKKHSKIKNRSPVVQRKKKKDRLTKESAFGEGNMYVADGFKDDVETLLGKCLQVYKLNFEKFTDIWKELNFPRIFHGRNSSGELAELSEEVIHIAKAHMLAKEVRFEENVAGLFLVYALLNHQPFKGFASLRLTPSDVPAILSLEVEARRQKRHDVVYVLGSVLIKGPCQFHVLAREASLEVPLRKYYDGTVPVGSCLDSIFTRNAGCVQQFKDLISLEQRYKVMRKKLRDRHGGKDKVSNLCKQPAATLYDLYRAHIPNAQGTESSEKLINDMLSSSNPEKDRSDLLKAIKERAMTNVVEPMRHLTGVDARLQDSTSSSSEESDSDKIPTERRPRVKGKGRSSAKNLQDLFGFGERTESSMPETHRETQREMPALNVNDDPTPVPNPNQTDKEKPRLKQPRTKLENKNNPENPKSMKRKNSTNTAKVKRKASDRNDKKDLVNIADLVSSDDRIKVNTEFVNESHSEDDETYNSKKTNSKSNNQGSGDQIINGDMPPIRIEHDKGREDIEMETVDDCKTTVKSTKKGNSKKALKKKNTISAKVGKNKTPNKMETEINEKKKIPLILKTKALGDKRNTSLDKNKCPPRRKTVKQSPEPDNSILKERSRKKSQRVNNQPNTALPSRSSPRKRKSTLNDSDKTVIPKKPKPQPTMNLRVKSSYKKLGNLEVASKSATSNKKKKVNEI